MPVSDQFCEPIVGMTGAKPAIPALPWKALQAYVTLLLGACGGQDGGSEDSIPAVASWQACSDMPHPTARPRLQLMADGVVAAYGFGTAVDFYDSRRNTWLSAPPMTTPRTGCLLLALQDGSLLVTGGLDAAGERLASAERYDPVTQTWAALNPMARARADHAMALLPDGRVLVAAGTGLGDRGSWQGPAPDSAEIYEPVTARWSPTGPMISDYSGQSSIVLSDGRVLIWYYPPVSAGPAGLSLLARPVYYASFDPVSNRWNSHGRV